MSREQKVARQEFAIRSLVVLIAVTTLLLLGALVANNIFSRQAVQEIRSCTNPSGECYQRNQESSGEAVQAINDAVICAAYYADRPGRVTEDEIRGCVEDRMRTRQKRQP